MAVRWLVVALVACAGVAGALLSSAGADNGLVIRDGTIVKAGERRVEIRDDRDEKHSFEVSTSAHITLNGKRAKLEDLKPGYFARVSAKRSGDRPIAMAVEAGAAVANGL